MSQKAMTRVKCTVCGRACEVPFKPTPGKPVFCRECFAERRSRPQSRESASEFEPKQAWARRRSIRQTQEINERNRPLRRFIHPNK